VRLPASLDVYYKEMAVEGESGSNPVEKRKALTVDLSGGGIQLLIEAFFAVGTQLQIEIMVPYRENLLGITAIGRVKRCIRLYDTDKWQYQAGIAFERISEADRSKIISFIYKKMVEDRYRNESQGGDNP
jgi:c-di-GMP-binding flagellar brake protein YcgR